MSSLNTFSHTIKDNTCMYLHVCQQISIKIKASQAPQPLLGNKKKQVEKMAVFDA